MAGSSDRISGLRDSLTAAGQGHVFHFWNQLTEDQRSDLIGDLEQIQIARLPGWVNLVRSADAGHSADARLEPAEVIRQDQIGPNARERGEALLAAGRVAAFTVAGGQGTRLGFPGPKGAFPITPVRRKPLFQLFAESIRSNDRRYGCHTRWYIMTSPANHDETRRFFETHDYFGVAAESVVLFQQGVMPAFDFDGRMLLEKPHRLALSPDGHGGSLLAMAGEGVLRDMAAHGIEHISYFQVDNPLVRCLDPVFLGLHDLHRSEMSSKTLPKADDLERVGNFVLADGKLTVVEYSDLPESLARAKNPDGTRRFDAANIAVHVLSRTFVERLTADPTRFGLPWHRAKKKVPYVELSTGRVVEPTAPNAIKLESFIFDALPLAERPVLMETSREEEFSPVKNADGVDSVETAQRDISRRAARWMEQSGWTVPRGPEGDPAGRFEISPLVALDAAEFGRRGPKPRTLSHPDDFYLSE